MHIQESVSTFVMGCLNKKVQLEFKLISMKEMKFIYINITPFTGIYKVYDQTLLVLLVLHDNRRIQMVIHIHTKT